jgi:hypothetical protein
MSNHRHPNEPLSFTYREIVQLLRGSGYERFASYVERLGNDNRDKNLLEREWQQRCMELLKRLHVYEPPVVHEPASYRAGPESDG